MSGIWVEAICEGCGEPLEDKDKAIAVIPATMRERASYSSGHNPGKYGRNPNPMLRVMPGKGRKGQQQLAVFHERCWPGIASPAGK